MDSKPRQIWGESRRFIWSGRWKPTVEINGFDIYTVYSLRPQNTESCNPEINNTGGKFQDKNNSILCNDISNSIWNQIIDRIQWFDPPLPVQLYNGTWMNFNLFLFLEEIISLYLFKRVADDLGVSSLRIKSVQVLQSISSTLITVPYIMKSMHVSLSLYLSLKAPLTITIPIYYRICQVNTYMGTWSQIKLVQRWQSIT